MDININDSDKITMTHTGLLPGKSGKVMLISILRFSFCSLFPHYFDIWGAPSSTSLSPVISESMTSE